MGSLGVRNGFDHYRARSGRPKRDVVVRNTAAYRGISLSLVMGFLAPLCIVIQPEVHACICNSTLPPDPVRGGFV